MFTVNPGAVLSLVICPCCEPGAIANFALPKRLLPSLKMHRALGFPRNMVAWIAIQGKSSLPKRLAQEIFPGLGGIGAGEGDVLPPQ